MKKVVLLFSLLVTISLVNSELVLAQKFAGLDKSPKDMVYYRAERNAPPVARVIYNRPFKKDRDVFKKLAPYGKVWRTGADEAPEITFYQDVTVGGKKVKAGSYALFTIPEEGEWTVILNSDLHQWGAYNYEDSKDVLRASAKSEQVSDTIENFSMTFEKSDNGTHLIMGWENTVVRLPIEF